MSLDEMGKRPAGPSRFEIVEAVEWAKGITGLARCALIQSHGGEPLDPEFPVWVLAPHLTRYSIEQIAQSLEGLR